MNIIQIFFRRRKLNKVDEAPHSEADRWRGERGEESGKEGWLQHAGRGCRGCETKKRWHGESVAFKLIIFSNLQKNPYWIENNKENEEKCPLLAKAKEVRIDPTEVKFWNDMIEQYLKPLYEDKDAKKKVLQTAVILNSKCLELFDYF